MIQRLDNESLLKFADYIERNLRANRKYGWLEGMETRWHEIQCELGLEILKREL
jgi:hypothetical protein